MLDDEFRDFKLFPDTPPAPEPQREPQMLAIDFDDELKAREALLAAARLGKHRTIDLEDAAIVTRTRRGTRIHQTRDKTPGQGAALGAWWLGITGLFVYGGLGWIVGALVGAAAGAAWAWWRDIGIDDGWMRRLGDKMTPGHAATVLAVRHAFPTNLLRELRRFDGTLLHNSIDDLDSKEVEEALAYIP